MTPLETVNDMWARHPFSGEAGLNNIARRIQAIVHIPPVRRAVASAGVGKKKIAQVQLPTSSVAPQAKVHEAPAWVSLLKADRAAFAQMAQSYIAVWSANPPDCHELADYLLACCTRCEGELHARNVLHALSVESIASALSPLQDRLRAPIPSRCACLILQCAIEQSTQIAEVAKLVQWLHQHQLEEYDNLLMHAIDRSVALADDKLTDMVDLAVAVAHATQAVTWAQQQQLLMRLIEGWEPVVGSKLPKILSMCFSDLSKTTAHQATGLIALILLKQSKSYPTALNQIARWITAMAQQHTLNIELLEELILQALLVGKWESAWQEYATDPLSRVWLCCDESAILNSAKQLLKKEELCASIQIALATARNLDSQERVNFACYLLNSLMTGSADFVDRQEILREPITWLLLQDPTNLPIDGILSAAVLGDFMFNIVTDNDVAISDQWLHLLGKHCKSWWSGARWCDRLVDAKYSGTARPLLERFLSCMPAEVSNEWLSIWVADLINSPTQHRKIAKETLQYGSNLPPIATVLINCANKSIKTHHSITNYPLLLEVLMCLDLQQPIDSWIQDFGTKGLQDAARAKGILAKPAAHAPSSKRLPLQNRPNNIAPREQTCAASSSVTKKAIKPLSVLPQIDIKLFFPKRVNLQSAIAALKKWQALDNRPFPALLDIILTICKHNMDYAGLTDTLADLVSGFSRKEFLKWFAIYGSPQCDLKPDLMATLLSATVISQPADSEHVAGIMLWMESLLQLCPDEPQVRALAVQIVAKGWLLAHRESLYLYVDPLLPTVQTFISDRSETASDFINKLPREMFLTVFSHTQIDATEGAVALNIFANFNSWCCWHLVEGKDLEKMIRALARDSTHYNCLLQQAGQWSYSAPTRHILEIYLKNPELYAPGSLSLNILNTRGWWKADTWITALTDPAVRPRALALLKDSLSNVVISQTPILKHCRSLLTKIMELRDAELYRQLEECCHLNLTLTSVTQSINAKLVHEPTAVTLIPVALADAILMDVLKETKQVDRRFALITQFSSINSQFLLDAIEGDVDFTAFAARIEQQSEYVSLFELYTLVQIEEPLNPFAAWSHNKRIQLLLPTLLRTTVLEPVVKKETINLLFVYVLRSLINLLPILSCCPLSLRPEHWSTPLSMLQSMHEYILAMDDQEPAQLIACPWPPNATELFIPNSPENVTIWQQEIDVYLTRLSYAVHDLLIGLVTSEESLDVVQKLFGGDSATCFSNNIMPLVKVLHRFPASKPIIEQFGQRAISLLKNLNITGETLARFTALMDAFNSAGLSDDVVWNVPDSLKAAFWRQHPYLAPAEVSASSQT